MHHLGLLALDFSLHLLQALPFSFLLTLSVSCLGLFHFKGLPQLFQQSSLLLDLTPYLLSLYALFLDFCYDYFPLVYQLLLPLRFLY